MTSKKNINPEGFITAVIQEAGTFLLLEEGANPYLYSEIAAGTKIIAGIEQDGYPPCRHRDHVRERL